MCICLSPPVWSTPVSKVRPAPPSTREFRLRACGATPPGGWPFSRAYVDWMAVAGEGTVEMGGWEVGFPTAVNIPHV